MADNTTTIEDFIASLDGKTDDEIEQAISLLDEDSQTALIEFIALLDEETDEEEITNDHIIAYGPRAMLDSVSAGDTDTAIQVFDEILTAKIADFLDDARLAVAESLLEPLPIENEITDDDIQEYIDSLSDEEVAELKDNDELTVEDLLNAVGSMEATEFDAPILKEGWEHGDTESAFADLSHAARQLQNYTSSGFMRNTLTRDNKKEIMGHVKKAHDRLADAAANLGDRDAVDHLNAAAMHLTDGENVYHAVSRQDWRTPGTTTGMAANTIPR